MSPRASRYRRYDGGDPLAPPVDLAEALDAIGQDVMAGYSPERAMREFLRRGGRDQAGLDDLARRVAERRRELLRATTSTARCRRCASCSTGPCSRSASSSPATSRWTTATGRSARCSSTTCRPAPRPRSTELSSYDWQSREAREAYEQIKDLLGRELLDQRFAGMKQALENATDEDRAAVNEMLVRPQRPAREAPAGRGHAAGLRRLHGQARRVLPREPARTSTSCSTRSPSGRRPRSGCCNSMSPEQRRAADAALRSRRSARPR